MHALRSDKMWKPAAVAIGLALVVHAFLLLTDVLPTMLRGWDALFPRPKLAEPTRVEMVRMTPAQFEQNRQLAALQPEPPPPPEPPKPKGQVVDLAPTPDNRPPLEARFLSEHNTRVERESVSADQRPDYAQPKPAPTLAKAQPRPKPDRPKPAPAPPEPKLASPEPAEQSQAEEPDQGADALAQVPDRAPGQARTEADPSDRAMPDDEAGAPAPDRIRGLPTGPATLLNSHEFMYATFFNRVKRLVGQFWHPSVRDELDRREFTGRAPTQAELVTQVFVSLEPNGDLENVRLVRSSGVATFDNLALYAFQQAAPFPNPPQGLAGPDGRIRFQFGFSISQSYGPNVQAFRPQRIR